jgi:signal transduction histidine kinase
MRELVDSSLDGAPGSSPEASDARGPGTGPAPAPRWQQALLPGALREEGGYRRSPRDWLVDLTMFGIALVIGLFLVGTSWVQHSDLERLLDIVFGVVAGVAVWWRRQRPTTVALVTGVPAIFFALPAGAALIALFSAVIRVPLRTLFLLALLGVAASAVFPLLYPSPDEAYSTDLVFGLLITGIVIGWGLFVRVQRQLVGSLRERTVRLESEQRLRVEQAREAERRRIAREMHDVLAHRLALVSLHAGALEFRPDAPPQEIAAAAGVVRASARAALEDLREVIGVLRESDGEAGGDAFVGEGPHADGAPEPPQPTLVKIPALVERSRAAGMRVACRIELGGLDGAAVGEVLGRTAYRVVQEGLTNAHKHAPSAAVEVLVEAHGGELVVTVRNRRPIGNAAPDLPGAGTGLIGLEERVALAGGTIAHGPDAAGDFVLRATLPWTAIPAAGPVPPSGASEVSGAAKPAAEEPRA